MSLSAILHHGTDQTFDTPRWDMGSERRDFGRCFYTTYSRKMADDWAKYKSQEGGGITYHYVIDFTKMASCNLRIMRYEANEEWAKFVYNNRYNKRFRRPQYDIIIGPLADNGLSDQFSKIKKEGKTFEEIAPLIEYTKYSAVQVCFCSDNALQLLRRIEL